jgi:zinc finger BED domain-containing protein 1 (E3 SUMO-protein ligase ZBED1)
MQILQIPATSASSERVFSTAGLTIANDRARLLPQSASMLIFLRGAWPIAEKFAKTKITGDDELAKP